MDNNDIAFIKAGLDIIEWLRVTTPFEKVDGSEILKGVIEIPTEKGTLQFDVYVSADFPVGKIEFYCTNYKGHEHMMRSGLLCLNASPAVRIEDRLSLELEKLRLWIQKYFVLEERDKHFEYYQFPEQRKICVIFEEDETKERILKPFGEFTYATFNKFEVGEELLLRSWIALNLGGRACRWSETFSNKFDKQFVGLWVKLDKHPVTKGRYAIDTWKDLIKVMSPEQTRYIHDHYSSIRKDSAYENSFVLMIGYDIPSGEGMEVHWDAILVSYDENFPYQPLKIRQGHYVPEDKGLNVSWCQSQNASYKRMFGRGKLPSELTEKNILIIGTGAIGSSLFMALVRGGCKKIEITESDTIEPGNICRGHFSFLQTGKLKVLELNSAATDISPYIDIRMGLGITAIRKENVKYGPLKERLSKFDYIFDCSTDKYLSTMLDNMQLPANIINLSISNEANHMAVITGVGNIHLLKSNLFDRISPEKREPFFVATGCWSPTFKASYTDINVLLMYALNEISQRMERRTPINSFYITKSLTQAMNLNYDISYDV